MKRNCLKIKKDLRDEKPSAAGVAEGSNLVNRCDILLATAESPGMPNWIFDSDCSFHMCSVRKHFVTYEPCEKGIVNITNGTQSRVIGVGIVHIHMFDG